MVTHQAGIPLFVRGHRIVELCRHGLSPVDNVATASPGGCSAAKPTVETGGILVKQITLA